jgi:hypothetical protein
MLTAEISQGLLSTRELQKFLVRVPGIVFWAYRGQDARGRQPRNFWVINHPYHGTISQSREILIIVISLSGLVLTRHHRFHLPHDLGLEHLAFHTGLP